MLLRIGLEIADRIVTTLPSRVVYRIADLGGDAWRRLAPTRRALVAANLARVCEATGRPTAGPAFRRIVRDAFRNHARYYVEVLRGRRYPIDEIDRIVEMADWPTYEAALHGRASMLVSWHLGNPEPFAIFLAARGFRPLAPIEVIEPRELFEFLTARRGAGHPELVPLDRAVPAIRRRLREGGMVGIVADRDLSGRGQRVTVFGHPTTMPTGPALLALGHGAVMLAGSCVRTGPDRFRAGGRIVELPDSGDRRADVTELTHRLARYLEEDVAAAPEQWWGSFQPFWPDLGAGGRA